MIQINDLGSRQPFGIIDADNSQIKLKIENNNLGDKLTEFEEDNGRLNLFATLKVNDIIIFQEDTNYYSLDWSILENGIIIYNALIDDYTNFEEFFVRESVAKKLKVYFSVSINDNKELEYETEIVFINKENSAQYKYLNGFDYTSRDTYMVENEPFYTGNLLSSLGEGYQAMESYLNIENQLYYINLGNARVDIKNKKYNIIEYTPYLNFEFLKPTRTKELTDLTFFDEVQIVYQFLADTYTLDINNVTGKKLIYSANVGSTEKSFRDLSIFNSPLKNNNLIFFIEEGIFDIEYHCVLFYDNWNESLYYSLDSMISDFAGDNDANFANIYLSVTPKEKSNYAKSISRKKETRYDINFGLRVYQNEFAMANDFNPFVIKDTVVQQDYDVNNFWFYDWANKFLQWKDNILIDSNYISLHFDNEELEDSSIAFYNSHNSTAIKFTAPDTIFNNVDNNIYTAKYYIFIKKNLLDDENINNVPLSERYFYNIRLINTFSINNPRYIYRNNNSIIPFSLSSGYGWAIQKVYFEDDAEKTNLYNDGVVNLGVLDNKNNSINLKIIGKYDGNNIEKEINQSFEIVDDIRIKILSPLIINVNPLEKDSAGYYKYFLQCQIYNDYDIISQWRIDDDEEASSIENEGNGIISTDYWFIEGGSLSENTLTIKIVDEFSEEFIKEIKIKVSIQDIFPPVLEERIPTIFVNNKQDEIKIPFYYPKSLDISEIAYEAKIFDMNNELKQYIVYNDQNNFGTVFENGQYFIKFTPQFKYDNFYKISIRLVAFDKSTFTPWSNVAFFKTCLKPSIFRLPWDLDIKDEFLCLFEDLWEPVEQVEYKYMLKYGDEENSYSSNKKILLEDQKIKESTNSYRFILSPFLLTVDEYFNEYISSAPKDTRFYLSVELNIITKNGCYNFLAEEEEAYSFLINTRINLSFVNEDKISIIDLKNDHYDQEHSIAYIFNNNINIYSAISVGYTYKDYTSSFKNVYDFYIIDLLKSDTLFYQRKETINDFYGAYLIDITTGKQLNISLNNKISSFKRNILETKTDTLGGIYPRFYKNSNTKYKEFPISGTISYQSLLLFENEFNSLDQYDIDIKDGVRGGQRPLNSTNLTNLEGKNIYSEYEFRKDVLDFLQNTNKFLYKSPTEGNIVVKLMNISLTPNQQLGRMIYDFSCTAYEVQDLQSYLGGN